MPRDGSVRASFWWGRAVLVALGLQPLAVWLSISAADAVAFPPPSPTALRLEDVYSPATVRGFLIAFELLVLFVAVITGLWGAKPLSGRWAALYCVLPMLGFTGSCGAFKSGFCPKTEFSTGLARPLPPNTEVVRAYAASDYGYSVVLGASPGSPSPTVESVYEHYRQTGWHGSDNSEPEYLWSTPWTVRVTTERVSAGEVRLGFFVPNQSGLC
jgi:hypothetical protein